MISSVRVSTNVPVRSAATVRFTCSTLGEYEAKWPHGRRDFAAVPIASQGSGMSTTNASTPVSGMAARPSPSLNSTRSSSPAAATFPRARAQLDDRVARLDIAIPDEGRGVLRADDLCLPADGTNRVSNRRGEDEERSASHGPTPAQRCAQRVRSDDTDRRDVDNLLVQDDETLRAGGLQKHDPIGVHDGTRPYNCKTFSRPGKVKGSRPVPRVSDGTWQSLLSRTPQRGLGCLTGYGSCFTSRREPVASSSAGRS